MLLKTKILITVFATLFCSRLLAQADTLKFGAEGTVIASKGVGKVKDTSRHFKPRTAIIRSAIIPGWGQVTNKKIWKVPIVYAGIGIPAYLFFRNLSQYKDAKNAYILATDGDPSNDDQIKQPYYSVKDYPERIRTFRNEVRQNVDYSALFFLVFWALNVADAAVDAHMKTFDVSDDLSLQIKPGYSPMARTNGISLVLNIGK